MVIDQNAGTFDQYVSFREFKKLLQEHGTENSELSTDLIRILIETNLTGKVST